MGNFWNYYSFNAANERLRYLTAEIATKIVEGATSGSTTPFCDLGCNEGDLSLGLHRLLSLVQRFAAHVSLSSVRCARAVRS